MKKIVKELYDGEPLFVSIVDRGSSMKTWRIKKRMEPEATDGEGEATAGLLSRYRVLKKMLGALGVNPDGGDPAPDDGQALSLCFDRERFTPEAAASWMAEHGLETTRKLDEQGDVLRVELSDPPAGVAEDALQPREIAPGVAALLYVQKTDEPADEPNDDLDAQVRAVVAPHFGALVTVVKSGDAAGFDGVFAAMRDGLVSLKKVDCDPSGEGDMDLKAFEAQFETITKGIETLGTRLDALEAKTAAPEPKVEPAPEPKPEATPETVKKTEPAPEPKVEGPKPEEDALGKKLDEIADVVRKGIAQLDERVSTLEGRVSVRKSMQETPTIEGSQQRGSVFAGVFN